MTCNRKKNLLDIDSFDTSYQPVSGKKSIVQNKSSYNSAELFFPQIFIVSALVSTFKTTGLFSIEKMGIPSRTGGPTMGADMLSEKAAMMRESLHKSQSATDNMVSMLGSFDHRLSALETAMRPTQVPIFWSLICSSIPISLLFAYWQTTFFRSKRICFSENEKQETNLEFD